MRSHTDSQVTEYHDEDGSWTTTTVVTNFPASRAQKAGAWAALVGICVVPVLPLVSLAVLSKIEEKAAARKERNRLKSEETDS